MKTKTTHTPGLWEAEMYSSSGDWNVSADGYDIAHLITCIEDEGHPNSKEDARGANARLIAAAPELLDALKLAEEKYCGCSSSNQKDWHARDCIKPILRAAIAKAEGK